MARQKLIGKEDKMVILQIIATLLSFAFILALFEYISQNIQVKDALFDPFVRLDPTLVALLFALWLLLIFLLMQRIKMIKK